MTRHRERYASTAKGERVSKLWSGFLEDSWRQRYSGKNLFIEPRWNLGWEWAMKGNSQLVLRLCASGTGAMSPSQLALQPVPVTSHLELAFGLLTCSLRFPGGISIYYRDSQNILHYFQRGS